MSRVRTRLEQYKTEIENKSQYKHGLPGSALDIVNTLLNDFEQDEKEKDWIIVNERLPEESDYYMAYIYNEILNKYYCRSEWFSINNNYYGELVWIDLKSYEKVVAWRSLPEPYKEDEP